VSAARRGDALPRLDLPGLTYYEIGEYHHRTGCREDFCGDEPVPEEAVAPDVGAGSTLAA